MGFLIWEPDSAQIELHMMPLLPFRDKRGKEPHLILSFAQSCCLVNTISPRNGRCSVICIYACLSMHREKILISATCCLAPQRRNSEQSLLQAVFNSSTEAIISSFIELGYSALQNSFAFAPRKDQLCINHSLLLLVETTYTDNLFQNFTILAYRIILTAWFILSFRCKFRYIQRRHLHVS